MIYEPGRKKRGEEKLNIIIAGGGTGGHLFPGIAVGNGFRARYPEADILFVTAGREIESQILEKAGFRQECLKVEGIKGRGILKTVLSLVKLPLSLLQSIGIIRKAHPDIILGVGGYSSGPLCLAGKLMGIPVAIHEQNSYPGLTNRILSRIADRVFISFEESRVNFPGGNISLTGNPVRDIFIKSGQPKDEKAEAFTVFVTGGSQGAVAVNSVFMDALEIMNKEGIFPRVIHHSGHLDYERVAGEYDKRGLKGNVSPFIENMADAYSRGDIFIGRAGAGTIFELGAMGKPAILIPLPNSANRHQEFNALALVKAGGAVMMMQEELTGEKLAAKLTEFMNNRDLLENMGENSRKAARPDATGIIVDQMCKLIGGN